MTEAFQWRSEEKGHILVPSRSTAYISSLPFSFTNSDLCKIFSKYGKIIRVTILKDKARKSKGVAFILFNDPDSALNCVKSVDGCEMFGRTLKANIAKDNGRATKFIRRREYPDKSRCYECGESGHLSYSCPKNILGEREPPLKKKKKFKAKVNKLEDEEEEDQEIDNDTLSEAIRYQQELREGEEFLQSSSNSGKNTFQSSKGCQRRMKRKRSSYFSDEEEDASD